MSHHKSLSAFTLVLALAATPVLAESEHHSAGTPPAATTAPQAMPGMGQGSQAGGMAGQGGMQGMGMMGMQEGGMRNMPMMGMPGGGTQQGGMQGMGMMGMQEGGMRNMPMMGMPGGGTQQGGMPMMGMMCNMMRGASMGGMPMMADRTEGRIAFLKTELKITDAQLPLWNTVADAIRANAKSGMGMMDSMGSGSLTERLAAREKALAAQAEGLRKFKSAVDPLYTSLNDEQKKTADELLMSPMGMM